MHASSEVSSADGCQKLRVLRTVLTAGIFARGNRPWVFLMGARAAEATQLGIKGLSKAPSVCELLVNRPLRCEGGAGAPAKRVVLQNV